MSRSQSLRMNRFGVSSFGGALAFAAIVGLAYPLHALLVSPIGGRFFAFESYLLLAAAAYLVAIAGSARRGVGAAIASLFGGGALILLGVTARELVIAMAILIGVLRSGLLYGAAPFLRRFAREGLLLGAGLLVSGLATESHALPGALAFWCFFLVQSCFFLGSATAHASTSDAATPSETDGFDDAVRRAREVLDRIQPDASA